jgi:hypothetical protein
MSAESPGAAHKPSYFLISVSTRENLELCIRYSLAGFPSGESGAWTFCEIEEGDFVSFLYGARAHNLYRVRHREALQDAKDLPPWKPLTFKESGKTYSFPFRLQLQPVRTFIEPIVRTEFYYVAENLLLRGGYRKTHFQADQTTLQSVSEIGTLADGSVVALALPEHDTFTLRFTRNKERIKTPETFRFQETILQSAIRRHLVSGDNLHMLLSRLGLADAQAEGLEVLGEKALTQGHIDLLLKPRTPIGTAIKIPIEVKTDRGQPEDTVQLRGYMDELPGECPIGILIASDFNKKTAAKAADYGIKLVSYSLTIDMKSTQTFQDIHENLNLQPLEK